MGCKINALGSYAFMYADPMIIMAYEDSMKIPITWNKSDYKYIQSNDVTIELFSKIQLLPNVEVSQNYTEHENIMMRAFLEYVDGKQSILYDVTK